MSAVDSPRSAQAPLKQYGKTKKRSREHTQDSEDVRAEKKKRRKHDELTAEAAEVDAQAPSVEEKKKKKKTKKHDSGNLEIPPEAVVEPIAIVEEVKKKKKRKHLDATAQLDAGGQNAVQDTPAESIAAVAESGIVVPKKKRKHRDAAEMSAGVQDLPQDGQGVVAVELPVDAPPKKKKSKGKEKMAFEAEPNAFSLSFSSDGPLPPPADISLFSSSNYDLYPGGQLNTPLFPTLSFPDLALDSNEDVLRAIQDLDFSRFSGVLQTVSAPDTAKVTPVGAGIPMTASTSKTISFAGLPTVPSTSKSNPKPKSSSKDKKSRQLPLDLTLPASTSSSETRNRHIELLTTKWMGSAKLAELAKSEGLVYKKGKFSAIEAKQISDAMDNFRASKDLSEADLEKLIWPSDEKKKDAEFWTAIASAVAERPLTSVYHYVRRACHPLKGQGKWTPEEDAKLIQAVTSLGQHWERVADRVGRMSGDCRDRYRNHIVSRGKRNTGSWSTEEEEELTRIVTGITQGKDLDNDVFWGKVSDLMGGKRSRQQCRIKWTDTLSKRFKADGKDARWGPRDASLLLHRLNQLNVRDDTEIDWKTIPDAQWNLWSPHVLQRRWLTMKKGVKGSESMTFREIMEILRVKHGKSVEYIEDSDEEKPLSSPSRGPGSLRAEGTFKEEDSDSD